jgi:uncharacterized protein YukE
VSAPAGRAPLASASVDIDPGQLSDFAEQVYSNSNSAYRLELYAGGTCATTEGLDGVLDVLRNPIELASEANVAVLEKVKLGLRQTANDVWAVAAESQRTDADNAAAIESTFPAPPIPFPDYNGPSLTPHGYENHWEVDTLEEPSTDIQEYTEEGIDAGGFLGAVDWVWEQFTGKGLLEQIVRPIVGQPGRLAWLADAYEELGGAAYRVAWNLRSGTFNVAPHWNGPSGAAFELHMFRWHMGLGGLGDAYHLIATALRTLYEYVSDAVTWVLDKIDRLIQKIGEMIAKKAGGPFGWVVSIVEAVTGDLWEDLQELVDDVRRIKDRIDEMRERIEEAKSDVETAKGTIELLLQTARDPGATLQEWVEDAYQENINFEGRENWEPNAASTARAALLPI